MTTETLAALAERLEWQAKCCGPTLSDDLRAAARVVRAMGKLEAMGANWKCGTDDHGDFALLTGCMVNGYEDALEAVEATKP